MKTSKAQKQAFISFQVSCSIKLHIPTRTKQTTAKHPVSKNKIQATKLKKCKEEETSPNENLKGRAPPRSGRLSALSAEKSSAHPSAYDTTGRATTPGDVYLTDRRPGNSCWAGHCYKRQQERGMLLFKMQSFLGR